MEFEAHYTKSKQMKLGLIGLGFAAGGVWMLMQSAADFEGRSGRRIAYLASLLGVSAETAEHAIGLFCLLFGLAIFPIIFFNMRHKGPALRINADGIYRHRWSPMPIPWSNVAKVAPYEVQRQKMVGITLIDPMLNKKPGLWSKLIGANRAMGLGDVSLSVQGTDGKYDDLVEALHHHTDQFR